MIASFRIGRHSVTFCAAGAPRAQVERETRSGCCKRGCGFGRKRAHGYFARFAWHSSPMPMPLTKSRTLPIARSRKRFGLRAKPASDGLNLKSIACSVISSSAADRAPRRSRVTSRRSPSPAHLSSFQLADLGGKANYCYRDQLWGGGHPLSGCGLRYVRLIAALLCQHGPSDPRQLVGEGSGQNVRMQALSGANEPESEAVL